MIKNVLIGSDPEAFLYSKEYERFVSSIDKIGGTKNEPRIIDQFLAVQEDNVAVEFNIVPASSRDEFVKYITEGIQKIRNLVAPYDVVFSPQAEFNPMELIDPRAQAIGCDPDYSIYGGECKLTEYEGNKRFAAGHIHIGYDNPSRAESEALVPYLDLFLGVRSVPLDDKSERRNFYGKAGSIRLKPYGVEYRVLSNFWLRSQELTQWVYDNTMKAVEAYNKKMEINPADIPDIVSCINFQEHEKAKELINKYGL